MKKLIHFLNNVKDWRSKRERGLISIINDIITCPVRCNAICSIIPFVISILVSKYFGFGFLIWAIIDITICLILLTVMKIVKSYIMYKEMVEYEALLSIEYIIKS